MRHSYTSLFSRSYGRLSGANQRRVERAIRRLGERPFAPFPKSLRVHKLMGRKGTARVKGQRAPDVWEMHAAIGLLVTFQYGQDEILFRNCGQHDDVLRSP